MQIVLTYKVPVEVVVDTDDDEVISVHVIDESAELDMGDDDSDGDRLYGCAST